jgi:MFS family permease
LLRDPHGSSNGVFSRQHRALTFGILLSITAVAIEGMAVATIMPSVAVELGGLEFYGWAFSAFMLTSLIGAIAAGQVADRRDPAVPALAGFALFATGLIISGLAPAWPILLGGRAVQGFGAGAIGSTAYVVVARGYPEALRPRLMALLSSAWVMPALVGPAIAGQVAEHASWRWVFIGILPPVAIGAWMLLRSLGALPRRTDSTATEARPGTAGDAGRVLTALRLTAGVTLILVAAGVDLPAALLPGALGLILAAPALRSLLPSGTFTGGTGLPASIALRGLLAFGFFGTETLIPLGLSMQRGLSPSEVGIALTAGALAWVAASWVQDRAEAAAGGALAQRAMRVVGGLLLMGLGSATAAAAIVNPALPVELVFAAWGVSGLGMGLCYPATTLTALGLAPSGQEGFASASLQVAETVGIATGTGAAGALVAMTVRMQHAISDGLVWGFLLMLAGLLLALLPAVRLASNFSLVFRWFPHPTD